MAKYTSNKSGGAGIGGSIDVEGLEKVKRIMKDSMQDAKKRRTLLKALRYGAVPVRKAMKTGTPVKTGNLRDSISTITGKSGMDGIGPTSVTVGAKVQKKTRYGFAKKIKNDGYYIGWVVKGHKTRGGDKTDANDFITPAFNSQKDIATKRIVDKLVRDVLEKNWK